MAPTADTSEIPPRVHTTTHLDRLHAGDRVVLGVSALVDDPVSPGVAQLVLVGELCPESAPRVGKLLGDLVQDGITKVHVDLAQVELCTAAGVRMLEDAREQLEQRGGGLELVNASGVVQKVLELTGLLDRR